MARRPGEDEYSAGGGWIAKPTATTTPAPAPTTTWTAPASSGGSSGGGGTDYGAGYAWDMWAADQARQAAAQAQASQLAREQMATQKAIAAAQTAYDYARLRAETEQAARQYALDVGRAELSRQLSTGWVQSAPITTSAMPGAGLKAPEGQWWSPQAAQQAGYAPTLEREQFYASLSGPADYWKYQRAIRGQYGNGPTVPWATSLQSGQALPSFQSAAGQLPGYWSGETTAPAIAPHQVNVAAWDRLLPSEKSMALGAASERGWDPQDWLEILERSRPTGTAGQTTWWQS